MNLLRVGENVHSPACEHVCSFHIPIFRSARQLAEDGYPVFPMFGLTLDLDAAQAFREAVASARHSHGAWGACLHLYESSEYAAMRLFVDANMLVGFALKGSEIVSVFSHRDRPARRASGTLMAVAVAIGGKRLSAFNTVLPEIYSKCGFRIVARVPWDDAEAPTDWDYEATKRFNGGRPDVVLMAHGRDLDKPRQSDPSQISQPVSARGLQ